MLYYQRDYVLSKLFQLSHECSATFQLMVTRRYFGFVSACCIRIHVYFLLRSDWFSYLQIMNVMKMEHYLPSIKLN